LEFLENEAKRLGKELKEKQRSLEPLNADRIGTDATERVKTLEQIARAELEPLRQAPRPSKQTGELRLDGFARHRGLGVEGRVVSLKGDRVTLQTPQGRRLEARVGELESIVRADFEASQPTGRVRVRAASQDMTCEINLIGRASDDIQFELHRFVEEALASGQRYLRVVHGHGTGRLKTAVREALQGHPSITRIEDAPQAQGGAGATVITLR